MGAWGCRAIVTHVDLVPDRADQQGTEAICAVPNAEFPFAELRRKNSEMLQSGIISTRIAEQFTLHESPCLTIIGNTNASGEGYFYIASWTGQP
jgi:hypothetical protein